MPIARAHHLARRLAPSCLALVSAAAVLAMAGDAAASGFATARFGAEHGHPTTDNPTAIYYNPAGIADRTPGKDADFQVRVMLDVNLALRGATYTRGSVPSDAPVPEGYDAANSGTASLFNVAAAPMAGAIFKIEDLALGVAFHVPFGGASSYSKNQEFENDERFAGPVDGVQRWASIDGSLRTMMLSFAAAYDIAKYVSVGAAFNLGFSEVRTVRAREVLGSNDITTEGRSLIDVSGTHASFGAGVLVEPIPGKLWIGASYQAQPGLGEMKLGGTLTNNFGGSVAPNEVNLFQELPPIYRLGVRGRPSDDVELRLFGDVTDWSVLENQCLIDASEDSCEVNERGGGAEGAAVPIVNLKRDWNTAFGVRAGGSYWPEEDVEVYGGLGYDSNAVPDETLEPALTDFHDVSFALGGRFTPADWLAFAVTYTHFIYISRELSDADSTLDEQELPTRVPDFSGEYRQQIGVVNANVELFF
jgi:long-chain fatty acid transport protein